MLQQQPNQPLPEQLRMRALKGFYAAVDGRFGVVNPGDVVDLPQALAMELRHAQKAIMVDAPLKRQKDYLPERKKGASPPADPGKQMALLTDAVAKLTQLVSDRLPAAKA